MFQVLICLKRLQAQENLDFDFMLAPRLVQL